MPQLSIEAVFLLVLFCLSFFPFPFLPCCMSVEGDRGWRMRERGTWGGAREGRGKEAQKSGSRREIKRTITTINKPGTDLPQYTNPGSIQAAGLAESSACRPQRERGQPLFEREQRKPRTMTLQSTPVGVPSKALATSNAPRVTL